MAVRGHFPYVIAAIIDMNGLLPFRIIICQILLGQITAGGITKLHDLLGQFTAVKAFAIAIRQKA